MSMYKGIIDSGWVNVNSLTVFVGKNESGKTSLLKALHKLNPIKSDSYYNELESPDIDREWPRNSLEDKDEQHAFCQAKFQFTEQEKSELAKITKLDTIPDMVEVSRKYADELDINFEVDIFSEDLQDNNVDSIVIPMLPKVDEQFSESFKQSAQQSINEIIRFVGEGRFIELSELAETHTTLLSNSLSSAQPPYELEQEFISQYIDGID